MSIYVNQTNMLYAWMWYFKFQKYYINIDGIHPGQKTTCKIYDRNVCNHNKQRVKIIGKKANHL